MQPSLIDRISARIDRFTLATLILLGIAIIAGLLHSVGNPKQEFFEFSKDRDAILFYASNTVFLFFISMLIQCAFFFFGTLYIRHLNIIAKISLILPFATGTIAPTAGFRTLFSSQLGPFPTPWFTGVGGGEPLLVALIDAWQWTGVLLFLSFACTERIPSAHFQQASLERISRFKQWRLIVWPAVYRMLAIYAVIKMLDWARKFKFIQILYGEGGGAGEVVKTFAMHAARRSYDYGMESYASGLALFQLILLMLCVVLAIQVSPVPMEIGRMAVSKQPIGKNARGALVFWSAIIIFYSVPVLWLILMSLQPSEVIFKSGFKILPSSITMNNFIKFVPWSSFCWSVVFYGCTSACAIFLALNETYRLATVNSSQKRDRRHLAAVIGIFFFPAFAVYSVVQSWIPNHFETVVLFTFSVLSGYALGFVTIYSAFKYGFRNRYHQFLLEFKSPSLAFWNGIIWPQVWIVCVAAILVFSTNWNELFLSDKWTSSSDWRPFAVLVGQAIEQYRLKFSALAVGAVISMLTPLVLGFLFYLCIKGYRFLRRGTQNA